MRKSWDEYFMEIALLASTRSTCLRRKVGAVIVRDRNIIATGYNGAPSKITHCGEGRDCLRQKLNIPSGERHEMCYAVHAEQNAIVQATLNGVSTSGATLYCTTQPCLICSKLIIQAHIVRVVFVGEYPDELARQLLSEAGIELFKIDKFVFYPSNTIQSTDTIQQPKLTPPPKPIPPSIEIRRG